VLPHVSQKVAVSVVFVDAGPRLAQDERLAADQALKLSLAGLGGLHHAATARTEDDAKYGWSNWTG
jgi:hypothetical protein